MFFSLSFGPCYFDVPLALGLMQKYTAMIIWTSPRPQYKQLEQPPSLFLDYSVVPNVSASVFPRHVHASPTNKLCKNVWMLTSCIIQVRKQKFAAMKSCDFKEEYSEGYFQYKSVKYPKWFIGFSRQGKPRSRRKGATKHRYRHFIRYDVPDKTKRKHRRDAKHRKKKLIKFLERELLRRWNV